MNKENEDKLANAIIALHQAIEKQGAKMNLALGELRLSYTKLDERVAKLDGRVAKLDDSFNAMRFDFNKYAQRNDDRADNHETRLVRLEEKPSGASYVVSEPAAKYKRKKRK